MCVQDCQKPPHSSKSDASPQPVQPPRGWPPTLALRRLSCPSSTEAPSRMCQHEGTQKVGCSGAMCITAG